MSEVDRLEFESLDDALIRGIITLYEYNEHHLNYFEKLEEGETK